MPVNDTEQPVVYVDVHGNWLPVAVEDVRGLIFDESIGSFDNPFDRQEETVWTWTLKQYRKVSAKKIKKWMMSVGISRNDADSLCRFLANAKGFQSYADIFNDADLRIRLCLVEPELRSLSMITYLLCDRRKAYSNGST